MTDRELLLQAAPPRDEELCRTLAAQFPTPSAAFSWIVFILFALPLTMVPGLIAIAIAVGATRGFGPGKPPPGPWLVPTLLAIWAVTFVIAMIRHAQKRGARRDEVRALFRDGVFTEAENAGSRVVPVRYGSLLEYTFAFEDGERLRRFSLRHLPEPKLPAGAKIPVLYRRGSRYAAAFVRADGKLSGVILRG